MPRADLRRRVLWPGVQETDLRALDERAAAKAEEASAGGSAGIWYLGSVLMREDEVVSAASRRRRRGGARGTAADPIRPIRDGQSPWKELQ